MFKQKHPLKKWMFIIVIAGIILATCSFLFFDRRVRPVVNSIAEVEATQMAVEAIQEGVRSELGTENISYNDFITMQKDDRGRVAVMQANTVRVNRMQAEVALEVQKNLQQLNNETIDVPAGQLFGSYILANWGPPVKVKVKPMGTVDVQVNDSFQYAGINQTRHKIYFDFTTMVRIVIPLGSSEVKVATQVPVAESVIVGDVPEVVADFSGGIFGGGR